MAMKIKFASDQELKFFSTLKANVDAYFEKNGISKNANAIMVIKTLFYSFGAIAIYFAILSGFFNAWAMLGLSMSLGFFIACIGFNIGHDAIHGAYSSKPWINRLMSLSFEFCGASVYVWRMYHNVVHHTYTNIPGADQDIDGVPIIKLYPRKGDGWFFKFQHVYAFFFYALTSLNWILRKDFTRIFSRFNGVTEISRAPTWEIVKMFGFKTIYYATFVLLPLVVLDITWWQWLIGFLGLHVVEGLTLAMVFQLAHVVEDAEFPLPADNGAMENSWAIHQLKTTANFSARGFIATWICGGLNCQVEHHLFPLICHVHYPKLANIVRTTAEQFGVPYYENRNFYTALVSHIRFLKQNAAA